MKTRKEYIELISAHTDELRSKFGIRSLCLFGSVSREEQKEGSDVDVCVEMEFTSSNDKDRVKSILEQIKMAISQLQEWNEHISSAEDYFLQTL